MNNKNMEKNGEEGKNENKDIQNRLLLKKCGKNLEVG